MSKSAHALVFCRLFFIHNFPCQLGRFHSLFFYFYGADVQRPATMSHTQVTADEAATNHKENNYGLFSLSADAGTASGSNLLLYAMAGTTILGMYLQYKSWKASRTTHSQMRQGKALTTPKDMRSRRVVLNDNPYRNVRTSTGTGTYRGMGLVCLCTSYMRTQDTLSCLK